MFVTDTVEHLAVALAGLFANEEEPGDESSIAVVN